MLNSGIAGKGGKIVPTKVPWLKHTAVTSFTLVSIFACDELYKIRLINGIS